MTMIQRVPQRPARTTTGYLAPVAQPHIYQHVPERFHPLLHELAQPVELVDAAAKVGYDGKYVQNHVCGAIREALHIDSHGNSSAWRVALTRLYYGIDRCWCQR